MIVGRCTPDGTHRFKNKALKRGVHERHFKEAGGLLLTSIGIGTYIGDLDPVTDAYMIQAVKESVMSGACNVIDTAINYRFMRSERCVRIALNELIEGGHIERDEVLVCTKAGYLTHDHERGTDYEGYITRNLLTTNVFSPDEIVAGIHSISPRYLSWSVEKSLDNMGVEVIDVLYLHNVAENQVPVVGPHVFRRRISDAFTRLEELRDRGMISYYGLATWNSLRVVMDAEVHTNLADIVSMAREIGGSNHGFKFVQLPFNLKMTEALTSRNQLVGTEVLSVFEACERLNLIPVTSAPLLEGMLLREVRGSVIRGLSRAQSLIQFARSSPSKCALVGQKDPAHLKENLELSRVQPLSDEEFERVLIENSSQG
ncbi:MAG: aldo/keto reductase [Aigarchaeota archaeon]|nr:aldo/keto reductase [Aigarchaeota archaeon]MDW8092244.1 aldo/keto reductase [Nitrososphaerota archaeon]